MEPNGYQFPQIVISSGEKGVWPDGMLLASFCPVKGRFGRMGALQQTHPSDGPFYAVDGIAPGVYCWFADGQVSLFRNPKNTFEYLPHSTAFY